MNLSFCRKLRQKDATKFDIQLCFAILISLVVFVAGIQRTELHAVCVIVAALIQYFTLAAMMWMAAEAFVMFQKLVIVFGKMATITTRYIIIVSLLCWGKLFIFCVLYIYLYFVSTLCRSASGACCDTSGHQP